ncbi:phosphoglycolate phosphatase [Rhodospirillum rubrum]|uniref:phosphoglycolate phosphatase n=1 Tax=Rhodospirillum rubrum TaxID=1085 RepID=UPI0019032A24|nr:phosphoglycolate phosphatase [Rhodospirillum rubrum]MBK1664466.1 phosphoglycolate phosphatase [Rhodospirillum rubrum]MBK1676172.1 phosphoglycolate phosphatase [Rhodospirillum rubrum]
MSASVHPPLPPRPFPLPKAVIFDLDGTLVHSLPGLTDALNKTLAEDDLAPLDEAAVKRMVGEGVGLLVARAFAAYGLGRADDADDTATQARLARFLAHYAPDPLAGASVYPGALALLGALAARGIRLGVCTNKPEGPARALLEGLGLADPIMEVVGGDTLAQRKPDPAPLRALLDSLGVEADQALMVGDSPTDVATAKAAGVPVVVMAYGYSREPVASLGALAVFDDFASLGDWLGFPQPGGDRLGATPALSENPA